MNFRSFFTFWYIFLGVICIITFPSLVCEQNYKKIIIFTVILIFLIIISLFLYIYFTSMAIDFYIADNKIVLKYATSLKEIDIIEIEKIFFSDYRYTILTNSNEKLYISRIVGPFKLQKNIDHRIVGLSDDYGIKIKRK